MQNHWVIFRGDTGNTESTCKTSESDSSVTMTTQCQYAKSLSQTQRWHGQRRVNMQNLWVRLVGDLDKAVSMCKISESDSEVTWTTQSQYAKPLSHTQRCHGQLRVNMQNLWVRLSSDRDNAETICKSLSQTQRWHGQSSVNMQNLLVRFSGDTDNAESTCKTSESDSAVTWTTQSKFAKPLSQTQRWHGQRTVNM